MVSSVTKQIGRFTDKEGETLVYELYERLMKLTAGLEMAKFTNHSSFVDLKQCARELDLLQDVGCTARLADSSDIDYAVLLVLYTTDGNVFCRVREIPRVRVVPAVSRTSGSSDANGTMFWCGH